MYSSELYEVLSMMYKCSSTGPAQGKGEIDKYRVQQEVLLDESELSWLYSVVEISKQR